MSVSTIDSRVINSRKCVCLHVYMDAEKDSKKERIEGSKIRSADAIV